MIVVAIIAVLVAIGIPIFTSQLEKSREAVDLSDVRSAYAEVMMAAITGDTTAYYTKDAGQTIYKTKDERLEDGYTVEAGAYSITVTPLKQKQSGWQTAEPITIGGVSSKAGAPYWNGQPGPNGYCIVTYHPPVSGRDEYVSFYWEGGRGSDSPTVTPDPGNPTVAPTPTGNPNAGNNIAKSATEIPEDAQYFFVTAGHVYSYKGKIYVALTSQSILNDTEYWVPGFKKASYLYVEIKPETRIKTSADLEPRDQWSSEKVVLKNLTAGYLYRDDNGNLYVYKYGSQGEVNDPPPKGGERWQMIVSN